ncbi:MAG: NOB1 family endonuclease [Phycisphaerales bacterium]|nr:NOB1 family endonuclease [Phycisphaerales bacterium]
MLAAIGITIVVLVPFGAMFLFALRWTRIGDLPACPSCRQCVRGTSGEICPECGNDLQRTGVITSRWRVKTRGKRLSLLLTHAISGFIVLFLVAGTMVTPSWYYRGQWTVSYAVTQGPIQQIDVQYPGWYGPDTGRSSNGNPTWTYPADMPIRLAVTSSNGTSHELLIEPRGKQFEFRAVPPSAGPLGPVLSSTQSSSLREVLGDWMIEHDLTTSVQSPEAHLVDQVVFLMAQAIPQANPGIAVWYRIPPLPPTLHVNVPGAKPPTTASNAGGGSRHDAAAAFRLLFPPWLLAWIIIGLFTLVPRPGTDEWQPTEY